MSDKTVKVGRMHNSPAMTEPRLDCPFCPRLAAFRNDWKKKEPDWHNAPVPSFGDLSARVLVVGLAPGLRGANATGRPFTGDYAGDLLYATLLKFGFAKGAYAGHVNDGLVLKDLYLTNAVRCVPPDNKPIGAEITTCNRFLKATVLAMKNVQAIVCLGLVSHNATLTALNMKKSAHKFAHAAQHTCGQITIFDSYHCSRYNTNTGRLTEKMFENVFKDVREVIEK